MLALCNTKIRKNIILALVAIISAGAHIGWQGGLRPVFAQSMDQISISLSVFDAKNEAVDGTFQIRFALYTKDRSESDAFPSNADAGARIWTETKTVAVKNGMIRTDLGDTIALPKDLFSNATQDYYLGIQIDKDSEMVPRKKVASVPSALNARAINGSSVGTASGDIPVLGNGGKLPLNLLPTGVGTQQIVLGSDGRLSASHDQNTDIGTTSNVFTIGSGSGLGASNFDLKVSDTTSGPTLRYDSTAGAWELANGDATFSKILTEASGANMQKDIIFTPTQTFGGSTLSELGYMVNARSNIQAQLDYSLLNSRGALQAQLDYSLLSSRGGLQSQIDALPHTASDFTSGTLPASLGGTGLDSSRAANGAILIGNGTGFTLGALQFAGAGLSIQNGSGFIKITNTGVAALAGTANQVNITGDNSLLTLSLPQDIDMSSTPLFKALSLKNNVAGAKTTTFANNADQTEDITYTLPKTAGAENTVLRYKSDGTLSWELITGGVGSGIGTVLSVAAGDGLASDVLSGAPITDSGTLSIALASGVTDTLNVSSPSGLEFETKKLSLLRGCASDQVLSWDETNKLWRCATIAGSNGLIGGGVAHSVAFWSGVGTLSSETNLAVSRGGTGTSDTPLPGQILIGNGVGYTLATVTPGAGITVTNSLETQPGSITIASTLGAVVDMASEVSGVLPVSNGGTGASTLTSNAVLYGNGTGVVQSTAAGIAGQFLLVNTSGIPTLANLSGDATLSSAGALTIASGAVTGSKIAEKTVKEVNLTAATKVIEGVTQPLTDGDVLTYNAGSGGFTWLSAGTGGIGDIVTIGDVIKGDAFNQNGTQGKSLWFHNGTKQGQLTTANLPTDDRTYTLPDASGTVITTGNSADITSVGILAAGTWNGNTVDPKYGGTGRDGEHAANGTLLIGNGSGYALTTLSTSGNGITVTNGVGSITLASAAPVSTVNGTNVTGSISGNILTLGWTGILAGTSGGTGIGSYTKGNLLYASATGTDLATLPIGTENYVLRSINGLPTWQEFSVAPVHSLLSDRHPDTDPGVVAQGDLITGQGTSPSTLWKKLQIGAAGTFLRSSAGDAVWGTASKTDVGLSNVDNLSLLSWNGSTNILNVGTIGAGTWQGSPVGAAYGGTGLNSSTWTGTPTITGGVWSVATSLKVSLGGTGTSTPFTPGSVVFSGTDGVYTQNNDKFFWDATNQKLGIGTKTPANTLQVVGDASISGGLAALSDVTVGGNINLSNTTNTDGVIAGAIFRGANRFIHNFAAPLTDGGNLFAGSKAGNFTLTGSYTTAVGDSSLTVLSTGSGNTAVGTETLLANTTGSNNAALGYQSLASNVTGSSNSAVGKGALSNITDSSNNVALGYQAGAFQSNGSTPLIAADNSVYIGYNARGKNNSDSNSIVIGSGAIGLGANTTVLGTSNTTLAHIFGDVEIGTILAPKNLTVNGTVGILEGGTEPLFHTFFQGGDQSNDITYILPTSNSIGFLKNGTNGILTWDGGSYPTGTGTASYNAYWTGPGTLGSEPHNAVSRGGTGIGDAPVAGQILVGTATGGYSLATITGSGLTVASTTGAISITSTAPTSVATSDANLRGTIFSNSLVLNWEGSLAVSRGGIGTSTLTQNGVLFGNGTNAISATSAGAEAQFLLASASGAPTFVTMGNAGAGDATISSLGTLTLRSGSVDSAKIANDSIKEIDLLAATEPSPGYILSYNSSNEGFSWIPNSGGTGTSKWTDGGVFTYLTNSPNSIVFGSDSPANAPFYFDVASGNITLGGDTNDITNKTVLSVTDPTHANSIVIPDASGELSLLGQTITTGEITDGTILPADLNASAPAAGAVLMYDSTNGGVFAWGSAGAGGFGDITQVGDATSASAFNEGGTQGTALWFHNSPSTFQGKLTTASLATADRTYTLPDASGTIWTSGNQGTGSLLDADKLDGHEASAFQLAITNPVTYTGTPTPSTGAAYWTGSGTVGAEAQLAVSRGGTGLDTTALSGVPTIAAGVWSVATSLGVAQGGTGAATLASKGVLYGNGTGAVAATVAGTEAQFLVANSSAFPTFVSMSGDATISSAGLLTIGSDAVALGADTSGNYVASIANGSGISGGGSGSESGALTLSLGNLTSNWVQTGAYDMKLSNANSELYIMDSSSAYYGIFDIGTLSSDTTFNFETGGTVWTSGNDGTASGLDADKLDGHETAYFQTALTNPVTYTGTPTPSSGVAYWTGSGTIGTEVYLATSRGGTGISTVGQTGIPSISNGTWSVASSIGVAQGGTGTTTQFTQGSIVFAGANGVYAQNNDKFFWDNTNSRLGIGLGASVTPQAKIDVKGGNTVASVSAERIASAGDRNFSSDSGKWTGVGWIFQNNKVKHLSAGTNPFTLSSGAFSPTPLTTRVYQISFLPTTLTSGSLSVSFSGGVPSSIPSPSDSTSILITAGADAGTLVFTADATWTGTIDDVSVIEVTASEPIMVARNSSTDNSVALEIRGGSSSSESTYGTFLGYQSGRFSTGSYNSFVGNQAGANNTDGSSNSAMGYGALLRNTTGGQNSAIGQEALAYNIAGFYNNAIGYRALYSNVTGSSNNAMGYQALYSNTIGINNVAVGESALYNNTTGSGNVALGYMAGQYQSDGATALATAQDSIYIGNAVKGYSNADTNSIVIGASAVGLGANTTVIGNTSTTLARIFGNMDIGSASTVLANKNLTVNGTVNILEGSGTDAQAFYTTFRGGSNQTGNITYTLPTANTGGLLRNTDGVFTWDNISGNVSGSGTNGYNAYWNGNSTIGSEQYTNVSRGGTGIGATPTNGQILIGNSLTNVYSLATISTSGTGVSVTNGVGSITIANTGVTSAVGTADQVIVSSAAGDVTFRLPQSIGSTSSPSFAGATLSNMTAGSILFAGTGGVVSQNNSNFFWDTANNRLGIGTTGPSARLDVKGTGTLASVGGELITLTADRTVSSSPNWSGNAKWTFTGDVRHIGAGSDTATLAIGAFSSAPANGRTYQIAFNAVTNTAGTVTISFGSNSYQITSPSGTNAIVITANGAGTLTIGADSTWLGYMDDFSVKEVTAGNSIITAKNADDSVALDVRGGSSASSGLSLGYQAGRFTTGSYDSFVGYQAGANNVNGNNNTALGSQALTSNTAGNENSAVGYQTLYKNTNGGFNGALGNSALFSNTTGSYNSAVGYNSLYSNTSGGYNNANGIQAMYQNTIGAYNTALGASALYYNTIGNYNIALGNNSLYNNIDGSNVVAIGYQAGNLQSGGTNLTGANNSIYIGVNSRGFNNNDSNSVVIGYGAVGLGMNTTVLGSASTTLTKLAGNLDLDTSKYINFGATTGTSGYGFYDNAGTIQFKNSGATSWQTIGETMAIGSPIGSVTAGSILFADSANKLGQSNADFFWDNTNKKLGIGTATPSELLQVLKTANSDTRIQISNLNSGASATSGLKFTANGGDALLYMASSGSTIPNALVLQNGVANAGPIVFNTTNNVLGEAMRITSYGNVGIGTTTPTANFQVNQPTTGLGTVSNTVNGTTVTGVGTKFTNTFKVGDTITIGGQSVVISVIGSDTSMTTAAILLANTNVAYTLTGGTRFAVAGNGTVSIGTAMLASSTTGELQVKASSVYDASLTLGSNVANNVAVIFDNSSNASDFYAGVDNDDSGKFKIGQLSNDASMTIVPVTGNVGIGTANPNHRLDVNGNMGIAASSYLNFGSVDGSSGYGFYDNAGTLQVKNSSGTWQNVGTVGGLGTASYNAYWTSANTLGAEQYVSVLRGGTGSGTAPATGQFLIGDGSKYNPGTFAVSGAGISTTNTSSGITVALDQGLAVASAPTFAGISIISGGSTLMSVTDVSSTFSNPTAFTAVGDVSMAYDLIMTNQTSSFIKSNGPLALESGEVFESNDLTLRTFNAGEVVVDGGAGAAYPLHVFRSSDGNVAGFTDSNGTCSINPTNTALICSSDATLKKDIVALSAEDSLAAVNKLRPVDFHWNSESASATLHTGLIAQEVQAVLPNLVSTGPEGKLAVNYLGLMPYALSAIQAQQTQIMALSDRIASLDLKTEQGVTTLGQLQASVDSQLTVIGDSMKAIATKQDATDGHISTIDGKVLSMQSSLAKLVTANTNHEDRIDKMETDMTTLKDENLTLMDFYSTFNLSGVVMKDEFDNVDLLGGKLTAKIVETGELVIEVFDATSPTIGSATVYPVAKDSNNDGNDDYTNLPMTDASVIARDGKSVTIDTTAASDESLIYVTPVGSTANKVLFVGDINNQQDFSVGMDAATTEAVRFNWWIVGKKQAGSIPTSSTAPSVPSASVEPTTPTTPSV